MSELQRPECDCRAACSKSRSGGVCDTCKSRSDERSRLTRSRGGSGVGHYNPKRLEISPRRGTPPVSETMADNPLNAVNRGVYISDNLDFLKALSDCCIDLVCIDPPFAKNETFGRKNENAPDPLKPPLTDEECRTEKALLARWGIDCPEDATQAGIDWPETAYKDFWSWEGDVQEKWVESIREDQPAVHALIEATRLVHGESTAAYLCYMAVRLFEIRRVLKDTGSLYLHCDHTAGAYLRQLLDGIFGNGQSGKPGFVNEIIWRKYTGRKNNAKNKFATQQDTILFYSKGDNNHFSKLYDPISEKEVSKEYKFTDGSGRRYRKSRGRRYQLTGEERRLYLDEQPGSAIGTLWVEDGMQLNTSSAERTGYPTQKPVALAERIIKASCPEGGTVLDCFAGCAYVAVAAERLGRNWVACDINARAWTVFKRQFGKPKLAELNCEEPTYDFRARQMSFLANTAYVYGPYELPKDPVKSDVVGVPRFRITEKPRRFKLPASDIPEDEMKEVLLRKSGYRAWCCGFANRMPDGSIIKTARNFHLDHIIAQSLTGEGTSHQITNRAPLCPWHNTIKGNQRMTLGELRQEIVANGELMVNSVSELVNLDDARQFAEDYLRAYPGHRRLPL